MKLIENTSDLAQLCRDLHAFDRLAIDTEFHAEHRYIPKLMLIQIAAPSGEVWIVDPLKVSPRPLKPALETRTLILHGARQDIRLLYHTIDLKPGKILDVQQADGLLSSEYPTRLSTLISKHLHQDINKDSGLSNWSHRPLNQKQLAYAAQDALILLQLAPILEDQLKQRGRMEWAQALGEELCLSACKQHQASINDWMNWDVIPKLSAVEQHILRDLFHWREGVARHKNRPVHTILSGRIALDLARRKPSTASEILSNRRIHHGLIKHNGHALLTIIENAKAKAKLQPLLTRQESEMGRLLHWWAQVLSQSLQIAPRIMLPDALAQEIARNGLSALQGWRRDALSDHLQKFLSGQIGITVQDGKPHLAPLSAGK